MKKPASMAPRSPGWAHSAISSFAYFDPVTSFCFALTDSHTLHRLKSAAFECIDQLIDLRVPSLA